MSCDPSAMPSHDFDDHYAVVRFSSRMKPVDCIGRYLHRCIESKCQVGALDVIVNGLRNTKNRNSMFSEQDLADSE